MDDFIKLYLEIQKPIMQQSQGIQSVRLLTDLITNKAIAVPTWASESDARASVTATSAQDTADRFEGLIAGVPTFEFYEVSVDY